MRWRPDGPAGTEVISTPKTSRMRPAVSTSAAGTAATTRP